MADTFVQLSPDSTGKKMDTRTEGSNSEHRQVMVIGDPATNAGVAPVDATKGLAVDLTNTGANSTAIKVDNSAVTQPVSGTVTANLGTIAGVATAAKQPALGTAGTASADVITIQGVASMTKLLVTPDANSAVNNAQINGVTPLMGNGVTGTGSQRVTIASDNTAFPVNATATGAAAHGASVSGSPLLNGAEARDTLGTATTTGQTTRNAVSRYGETLTSTIPPSHASSNGTPITATTTSVISAPGAGSHNRIARIHMSNGGATSTWVSVRDGAAGTQYYRTYLVQGAVMSINLRQSGVLDQTTATRLDIVLSASGSVEYQIDYVVVAD